jgi:hypothetical protein
MKFWTSINILHYMDMDLFKINDNFYFDIKKSVFLYIFVLLFY